VTVSINYLTSSFAPFKVTNNCTLHFGDVISNQEENKTNTTKPHMHSKPKDM